MDVACCLLILHKCIDLKSMLFSCHPTSGFNLNVESMYQCLLGNMLIFTYFDCFIGFKVRGPFVQTLCIEKDSYMDAI